LIRLTKETANSFTANSVTKETANSVTANSVTKETANSVTANSVTKETGNSVTKETANSVTANSMTANSVTKETANSVMSTPAHFDSEIISQTDRAHSSRVPTPLPDDPYVAVRQAHLVDTDTKFRPLEDLRETEIPQPLPITPSPVPSSDDPYLIAIEPSDTRITTSHSIASSNSTTPLSPDHLLAQTSPAQTQVSYYRSTARMVVRTQPTLSPGMSARIAEVAALSLSLFCKRYRSSYETPSPSSSPTLPIRKRYRGTSELVEDIEDESLDSDTEGEGSEDEGPGSEEEEVAPEGQQQAVLIVDTFADEPLGLGYEALRRRQQRVEETLAPRIPVSTVWIDPEDSTVYLDIRINPRSCVPVQTLASPEWSFGSLPVSPSSLVVPTLVASPANTPATTIAVDEDEYLEESATVTFGAIWGPVLALESWAGYVNAQRAEIVTPSSKRHWIAQRN
ncbi:hypothetical protein Tco_0650198, partial [Tanacetum coccineum]